VAVVGDVDDYPIDWGGTANDVVVAAAVAAPSDTRHLRSIHVCWPWSSNHILRQPVRERGRMAALKVLDPEQHRVGSKLDNTVISLLSTFIQKHSFIGTRNKALAENPRYGDARIRMEKKSIRTAKKNTFATKM
jgi:hypothetical protein